jgi:nitrate reductase gamma subunit
MLNGGLTVLGSRREGFAYMSTARRNAVLSGTAVAGLLGAAIFVGSNNLRHIDAALVGYTFACLFAAFGLGYRYAMWLQRPATWMYWKSGWRAVLRLDHLWESLRSFGGRFVSVFLLNAFIWRRSKSRGVAHLLIMWGCILAAAITFPLVFGWVFFETVPGDLSRYRTFAFGVALFDFPHESLVGHMIFHGLVWSSFLVIAGVLLALRRRFRDHGAAALQSFQEDILPLFLLFAVSVTGLLLTVSYTWLKGYAYEFLGILHAVTVIFTLLWLPFGKFFHIFQRPAQLGVKFYRDLGGEGEQAECVRCQHRFATKMHIEDLIAVERGMGYRYEMPSQLGGHYQRVCPACRRKMLALAQGSLSPTAYDGGPADGR